MTHVYTEDGVAVPVTAIEVGPCPIISLRTQKRNGYSAFCILLPDNILIQFFNNLFWSKFCFVFCSFHQLFLFESFNSKILICINTYAARNFKRTFSNFFCA